MFGLFGTCHQGHFDHCAACPNRPVRYGCIVVCMCTYVAHDACVHACMCVHGQKNMIFDIGSFVQRLASVCMGHVRRPVVHANTSLMRAMPCMWWHYGQFEAMHGLRSIISYMWTLRVHDTAAPGDPVDTRERAARMRSAGSHADWQVPPRISTLIQLHRSSLHVLHAL